MNKGYSLVELLVVLVLFAALLAFSAPRLGSLQDRSAVRSASTEVEATLAQARHVALLRSTEARVIFSTSQGAVSIVSGADTILWRAIGAELGVTVTATRDTIRYAPTGRGFGAANSTIVLRRGSMSDTVIVSRLGRVRDSP
jgi:prepilin-type N-terminal cleavage/methylation domain-containing protein